MGANGGDDGLEVVAVFSGDADLIAKDLGCDLDFCVADKGGDLFGRGRFDALLNFDDLAGVAEGRDIRIAFFDAFEADLAFREFADDDFFEGAEFELIFGAQLDFVFFEEDLSFGAFEIEAVGEFFIGLVDGILDFHRTYF